MPSDFEPTPEPRGALVPPTRTPPTAVATDTPPPPRPRPVARAEHGSRLLQALGRGVTILLDAADTVGDAIREAVGLAGRPGTAVVRREDRRP